MIRFSLTNAFTVMVGISDTNQGVRDLQNNNETSSTEKMVDITQGQVWSHYKGGEYTVICLSHCESDGKLLVTYQKTGTSDLQYRYTRPHFEFTQKFQFTGERSIGEIVAAAIKGAFGQ